MLLVLFEMVSTVADVERSDVVIIFGETEGSIESSVILLNEYTVDALTH